MAVIKLVKWPFWQNDILFVKTLWNELSSIRRTGVHHSSLGERGFIGGGWDTVTKERTYHWDGMRRGEGAAGPTWLFQYSVVGNGLFQTREQTHCVEPGWAFCATIPSAHLYRADPACDRWEFFWLMVSEPYVTRRLLGHANLQNRVLPLSSDSPWVRTAVALLEQLARGESMDSYRVEEEMFRWMLECERWADREAYPVAPKTRLLNFVRHEVLQHLESEMPTSTLAGVYGMDRTNFSHHFRKLTGHTPAAYVREVKLEQAAHLLRNSSRSVKEIAGATGFSGSNQLCKSFRRFFKMSPGSYRAMYRG